MTDALVKLSNATQALAEAKNLDEVKHIRDLATAAQAYARAAHLGLEAQNHAAEIKLRAERKAGEMLAQLATDQGGVGRRGKHDIIGSLSNAGQTSSEFALVLDETNTSRQDANRWQQIARLPEPVFEQHVAETTAAGRELTTGGTLKAVKEHKRRSHKAEREREAAETEVSFPAWLMVGDFREVGAAIPDNSVDMIFTDPPYDERSAKLYGDLAAFGLRVLKPGGICLAYSGQMHLPEVYFGMGRHLEYMWTCGIGHSGGATPFRKWRIFNIWKPLLMYGKPPVGAWWDVSFRDFTTGGREKDVHAWQQAVGEAEHYIGAMCPRGGIVCDPFLGGGTSLVAAKRLGMRYIGIEINQLTANLARQRIEECGG